MPDNLSADGSAAAAVVVVAAAAAAAKTVLTAEEQDQNDDQPEIAVAPIATKHDDVPFPAPCYVPAAARKIGRPPDRW